MSLPQVSGDFAVTHEPELRFTESGAAWLKIRAVAKDRTYDADTKEWKDTGDPCYIDILVNGKTAENLYESVGIGDVVVLQGRLHFREYETNEGVKVRTHQIRATLIGVDVRYGARPKPGEQRLSVVPDVAQDDAAPF